MSFMSRDNTKDNTAVEPRFGSLLRTQPDKAQPEIVTTFGPGMLVTGNVICAGAVQVFGRVQGDIRAAHLIIGEGAYVEGTITARDAVIQGTFKGTVRGNAVKLQGAARVDGEIYNKSLSIEPNVVFEGNSRRLDQPVAAPTADEVAGRRVEAVAAPALTPAGEPLDLMPQQFAHLPDDVDNDVLA